VSFGELAATAPAGPREPLPGELQRLLLTPFIPLLIRGLAPHRPLLASPCVFPHSRRRSPVPNAGPIHPHVSGDPPPAWLSIR